MNSHRKMTAADFTRLSEQRGQQWEGEARQALSYAGRVLDAADAAVHAEVARATAARRELLARQSENAEIIAVHDKLQAGRLGMHPLIAAMCQVAAGASLDEAMRDIGYVVARQVPLPKEAAHALFERWYDADLGGVELVRMTEAAHGICAAPPSPTATDVSEYSKPDQAPSEDGYRG